MVTFQFEPQYLYLVDAFLKEIEGNIDCIYEGGFLVFLTDTDAEHGKYMYKQIAEKESKKLKVLHFAGYHADRSINIFIKNNPNVNIIDIKFSIDSSSEGYGGTPECLMLFTGLTEKCVGCDDKGIVSDMSSNYPCPLCSVEKTEAKRKEVNQDG